MNPLSNTIIQLTSKTDIEICRELASRIKSRRLELNFTQQGLASRAGVNIETYRKFERTGEIALRNLVKIALALEVEPEFEQLFGQRKYERLSDVINANQPIRKRGKKK